MLTNERIRELFNYNKVTGIFTRLVSMQGSGKVGSEAGNINKSDGYKQLYIDGKQYRVHRLAWFYEHGYMPNHIDHINHNKLDNSIENLREVTHQENHRNRTVSSRNTSGFIGVSFDKLMNKWQAYIHEDGKKINLGYYSVKDDAIEVRKKANIEYCFHKNHGEAKC